MGIISRRIFPACESMCVCCPALRSRSRQPVKRYKKLLSEIFPKSLDAPPNERKIVKLCEYAAKNPFRIPKIAKFLEERCYKELRCEHIRFIHIVTEAYNTMLCVCKEQMVYFAASLFNVVSELLDNPKQDATRILGCQTLTKFIYSQKDGIYTHNIEKFVHNVCLLACESGEEHQKCCLRASSLQCLSAMVWFMGEFSYIFAAFDEVVHVTLDNYDSDINYENNAERGRLHSNWVNEVIRCEIRGTGVTGDTSPGYVIIRPQAVRKDPSLLTREETESPKVWAQICLQRMVELVKESTTLRHVLDPMFAYFDSRQQWVPPHGLAMIVLSDMAYLMERSGNQQLVLASAVRHLDHKNVVHNPQLKTQIVQVAAALAKQIRFRAVLRDISFVGDLCRHLRKSLQAMADSLGEPELNLNSNLQKAIEDCLLETAKGVDDARPLFDMMAISLEKLPSSGIVSRAAIGSLLILSHALSAALSSQTQQIFPEALLVQLLKVMLHPNVETRIGAHRIFSVLLIQCSSYTRRETASVRSGYLNEPQKWCSDNASASASIVALLEKLRKEKDGSQVVKNGYNVYDDSKNCSAHKTSPNFYKLSSIIDRTAAPINIADVEPFIMKFTEDQLVQLLSSFWIQAALPDNLPSNIEAISHSLSLALLSSRLKNPNDSLAVHVFQLLLSLRNIALDSNNGTLPPVCQRSVLVLSTGMLMFAAKIYHIPYVSDMLKSVFPEDVDPYLGISSDLQVCIKPQANMKDFGSMIDNQMATSILFELREKLHESDHIIEDILVKSLSTITKLEEADVQKQLSEPFAPDDAFIYCPQSILDLEPNQTHSKESLSFDEDIQPSSLVEDDAMSEPSVTTFPKMPASPAISHIISIGQLMESALEVASQVVGSSVSTSPLPYDTMANHCEAFGTGTRKKLSSWLANENCQSRTLSKFSPDFFANEMSALSQVTKEDMHAGPVFPHDPYLSMRLPPASPFDNFLKAARY